MLDPKADVVIINADLILVLNAFVDDLRLAVVSCSHMFVSLLLHPIRISYGCLVWCHIEPHLSVNVVSALSTDSETR
jgi:hypothetical protein